MVNSAILKEKMYYRKISLGNSEHEEGNLSCSECWRSYPKQCKCGGLVHAEFIKESWDGDLNINFSCDKCGSDYKEFTPLWRKKYVKGKNFRYKPVYRENKKS